MVRDRRPPRCLCLNRGLSHVLSACFTNGTGGSVSLRDLPRQRQAYAISSRDRLKQDILSRGLSSLVALVKGGGRFHHCCGTTVYQATSWSAHNCRKARTPTVIALLVALYQVSATSGSCCGRTGNCFRKAVSDPPKRRCPCPFFVNWKDQSRRSIGASSDSSCREERSPTISGPDGARRFLSVHVEEW